MARSRILLLRCPGCKNTMKYMPMKAGLEGRSKRCVYCGKSFRVLPSIVKGIDA